MSGLALAPLPWLVASALALFLLPRQGRRRWRIASAVVFAASAMLCTPLGANLALWLAERTGHAHTCDIRQSRWPIVLLSGGFDHPPRDAAGIDALNTESLERAMVARDLALKSPDVPVIVSGGGPHAISEATVLATLLRQSGIPGERLVLEQRSTTTWESAEKLHGMQHARLVTSPAHMQRAAEAFQAAGVDVCAWPTASDVRALTLPAMLWPGSTAVTKSETALHELAGRWVYRLRRQLHADASRGASKGA